MAANLDIAAAKPPKPKTSRASSILSYLILLSGVLTIAVALYIVVISYSSLPYSDQWAEVAFVASGGDPLSVAWLWEKWQEHRLVIPKLFLAADLCLFRGRQIFLLASIFAIQLLHLALLSWSMRVLGGWRGALWRSGTGLVAFCLFFPTQWENFTWGFQVCFVLPQLLATLSFVALLLHYSKSQQDATNATKFLVISILAALGATYSLASGNLLWPLLAAVALYLRLRRGAVLSLVTVGLISTGLYFYHFVRPGHHPHPILFNLIAPLRALKFGAAYLFGALAHRGTYAAALIVLAGAVIAIIVFFPALPYIRGFRVFGIQLVLMLLFWGATAAITTLGRSHAGLWYADVPRYHTVALLFWCCVGLLFLGSTFFARPRMRYSFLVAQGSVLLIFLEGAGTASYPIAEARHRAFALNVAAVSLLTGVYDVPQLDAVYLVRGAERYLQANQLSVFSGAAPSELGKPLEYVFPVISFGDCTGALESFVSIEGPSGRGLRVTGWVWDIKHQQPPPSVVITTDGVIRGLGAVGQWRSGVRVTGPTTASGYLGYVGYVPEPPPGSAVNVYAVLRSGRPTACYFATKVTQE